MLTKDGRTAGFTAVDLLHQLVDDVLIVVHIYATSLKSTTEDQVTIRLQLLQTGDQETKAPDLSLRFSPLIGSLEERARQCYDLFLRMKNSV
jgi:hypothetical protein